MSAVSLRAAFPVCERLAYLNAGVRGPLPEIAVAAAHHVLTAAAADGRGPEYAEVTRVSLARLREAYAEPIGAPARDVAVTTGTSEGIATVVAGLRLKAGDEVLTAMDEHAGVLGVLGAARRHLGVVVRAVPAEEIADHAVPGRTRLIVCSAVSWASGRRCQDLTDVAREVPVVLDGAQTAGVIGIDVPATGCLAFAASGQKWLCGPTGTGFLYVDPVRRAALADLGLAHRNLQRPADGLAAEPWPDARALDSPALAAETIAAAQAAAALLAAHGWDAIRDRAGVLAHSLEAALRTAGRDVLSRGESSLVCWREPDAEAFVERAARAGVVVRSIPRTQTVRASVGAWNDGADLERLLAVVETHRSAPVR